MDKNWKEDAERYAANAEYWRGRAGVAEDTLASLQEDARHIIEFPQPDELERWLKSRHCSFWGAGFSIVEGKGGIARAAEWLRSQLFSFEEWRRDVQDPTAG